MTFAHSPIPHRDLLPHEEEKFFPLMRQGSQIMRRVKDNALAAHAAAGILSSARFGGEVEELAERLLLPYGDRCHLKAESVGLTKEQVEKIEVFRDPKNFEYLRLSCRSFSLRELRSDWKRLPLSDEEKEVVADVESITMLVIQGYVHMVCKLAKKLANNSLVVVDEEDLVSVGLVAVEDAMWGYNRDDVKFLTFAQTSAFRRMVREISRAAGFCKSPQLTKVLSAYARAFVHTAEDNDFESVLSRMRIKDNKADKKGRPPTPEEIDALRSAFVKTIRGTEMESEDGSLGIDSIADDAEGVDIDDVAFSEVIAQAHLTSEELDLLLMSQSRGGKSEWARKHGYSRNWAQKLMVQVNEKLKRAGKYRVVA